MCVSHQTEVAGGDDDPSLKYHTENENKHSQ